MRETIRQPRPIPALGEDYLRSSDRRRGVGIGKTAWSLKAVHGIANALTVGLTCYFLYCMFFPWTILTVEREPLPVLKAEFAQGEALVIWFESTKYVALEATMTARWVDTIVYQEDDRVVDRPIGKKALWASFGPVPRTLPPGEYYVEYVFHYRPNIFRTVNVRVRTETFKVVAKEG